MHPRTDVTSIYIGGAFNKYRFIVPNLIKWKNEFKRFHVTFYDSWANSPWNGGRINIMYARERSTLDTVRMYNRLGYGVGITFTNPVIDDVNSPAENELLTELNRNTLNAVTVSNDQLATHIRSRYPNIMLIRSITTFKSKIDIKLLHELEQRYDLICPRYDWVFNPEFYENVNIKQYEILTNDCCMIGCPRYTEHYAVTANYNRMQSAPELSQYKEILAAHECWISNYKDDNISTGWAKDHGAALSCIKMGSKELGHLSEIGYKHFKFLGKASMNKDFVSQMNGLSEVLQHVR